MDLDVRLHRAFDRVELVSGSIGNPGEGRMCLMSLVAFLAGEAHSDTPRCASPLIQTFAVLVNDHMPREARQRLKPFAPRIIGTNDGFDRVRTEILRHALAEGILARAPDECLTEPPHPHAEGSRGFGAFGAGSARTNKAVCSPFPAPTASTWRGRRRG